MRKWMIAALLALFVTAPALGQRVVHKVIPPEELQLRFDSNDFPLTTQPLSQTTDFNFSPNVVFTSDSKRGFVAFPGNAETDGNQVMAFDVETGEVLALMEVGPNPFFLSFTPDRKRLGVASLYLTEDTPRVENGFEPKMLGSISVIDVDSYEVHTLELDDVGFSVFNNVVFSADGSTGFVASAGTDEIIRFDVESMAERRPRLKLQEGSRPASITMSSSGDFFLVVLPGSSALPQEEVPDSIQVIDTATFSVRKSIVPDPNQISNGQNTVEVPHNFFGANNLSISKDDKYAIIGDRENSSASVIPELSADHALLIDVDSGEVIQQVSVGGGAGASRVSPDGRYFALISAVDLLIFDVQDMQPRRASSGSSQFRETSRPAFTPDGSRVYVASPILDLLNVYIPSTATLTHNLPVGQDYVRASNVPAGPLDVAVTPNGATISVVNFNANEIDLLENTQRLTSPQMVADNIDTTNTGSGQNPEPIPASERFFSGLAVSNYGDKTAEVILTAEGFLRQQQTVTGFYLTANPIAVQVCEVGGLGQTTLNWDVTDVTTSVEIHKDAPDGPLVTSGSTTGSYDTGETVEDGTVYYLIDAVTGELLDNVTVVHTELGCPPPYMLISPSSIQVCNGSGLGQTTVFWDTTKITDHPQVHIGSATGPLFANIGPGGSLQTGRWVTDGMKFVLIDGDTGDVLDEDVVTLTDENCPLSLTQNLLPNQQQTFTPEQFLATNAALAKSGAQSNLNGWVNIDTDVPTLAGTFLTYDGALNRIDGGPISRDTTRTGVLPEIQVFQGRRTTIEVTNPNLTGANVLFDLFNDGGELVASSLQTVVGADRQSFPILGDPDKAGDIGLFDSFTGLHLIGAFPNPIQVCGDATVGMTTISWNATGYAESIEVRRGSPDGEVFASGDPAGNMETGEDVEDGTVFYLINADDGKVLDMVRVTHNELGCDPPYLDATPNPIRVCDGGEFGLTTLQWNATDIATMVELRKGAADGELLTTGEANGFFTTGRTVADGTTYYLVDPSDGKVLDTETVKITREECPLAGFTGGYMRVISPGTVSFEIFGDSRRMSVLSTQDPDNNDSEFVIPHFAVFNGSETILNLLHPSSIPPGGIQPIPEEGEEEPQPKDPLQVTVRLHGNDGSLLAEPLELELADGIGKRGSLRELFGLADTGETITGWIEVSSDLPGLIGFAEIRIFGGEAASAVALQPVSSRTFVFSHVAEGLGFGTGLALVNPGPDPALVTIELRNPAGTLLGSIDNYALGPGERLMGLISELFPDAGDLLGGTLKVISDQPLGNLELFFTQNEKLLSAVPATYIQ